MMRFKLALAAVVLLSTVVGPAPAGAAGIKVGAAACDLEADDSMVIAGGILPRYVKGQEGKLRAVAVVLEGPPAGKVAIVACDALMMVRDLLDPVAEEIERTCGIPASNVMIHFTHTHHAPSTMRVHGYDRDEVFSKTLQRGVVQAVRDANARLSDATFHFKLGEEKTVGQNSRLLLADGKIYWVGSRDDAVRPTGPFDPELPVLAFRDSEGGLKALLFNHSTHTIGALTGNLRSPALYGMVAQELESELGGMVAFLEGASGSTHRLDIGADEAAKRIKQAALQAYQEVEPRPVERLVAVKRPFTFKVRTFDEATEDHAVAEYCNKRAAGGAETIIAVFRQMRKELAPHQGEERTTWLQVVLIGDVAIVGVPAEFFTKLGVEIKRRSPFPDTYIAELSNDWIGYVGDREAYDLGGYQIWMGLHSYCEPGTGERIVDDVVKTLEELAR
ncbi:MAG: hypothetical protein ABIP48_27350 [Planctomycetota bacterium]